MHAADGLSTEDAEALRAPLAAMTVRVSNGSLSACRNSCATAFSNLRVGECQGAAPLQRDVSGRHDEVRKLRGARHAQGCAPVRR